MLSKPYLYKQTHKSTVVNKHKQIVVMNKHKKCSNKVSDALFAPALWHQRRQAATSCHSDQSLD